MVLPVGRPSHGAVGVSAFHVHVPGWFQGTLPPGGFLTSIPPPSNSMFYPPCSWGINLRVYAPDVYAIQKLFSISCSFFLCPSLPQALPAVLIPESFPSLSHLHYLSFSLFFFFLIFPPLPPSRFSSFHINVFSLPCLGLFTLSSFLSFSLYRDPVGGMTQLEAVLGPSTRAIPYGQQPQRPPWGHHLASAEDKEAFRQPVGPSLRYIRG